MQHHQQQKAIIVLLGLLVRSAGGSGRNNCECGEIFPRHVRVSETDVFVEGACDNWELSRFVCRVGDFAIEWLPNAGELCCFRAVHVSRVHKVERIYGGGKKAGNGCERDGYRGRKGIYSRRRRRACVCKFVGPLDPSSNSATSMTATTINRDVDDDDDVEKRCIWLMTKTTTAIRFVPSRSL